MSAATAGLVTAIPVLCFALLAPAVTLAGQRAGIDAVALAGCLLIRAGSLLRVLDGTTVLLAGTVLVGAGITTGNILAPVVVRRDDAGRTAAVARGLAGVDRDRRTRAGRRHRAGDGADRARRRLQATGGWTVPLLVLVAASVVMAVAGWTGGRELRPGRRWR